jgi:hypothetical protein
LSIGFILFFNVDNTDSLFLFFFGSLFSPPENPGPINFGIPKEPSNPFAQPFTPSLSSGAMFDNQRSRSNNPTLDSPQQFSMPTVANPFTGTNDPDANGMTNPQFDDVFKGLPKMMIGKDMDDFPIPAQANVLAPPPLPRDVNLPIPTDQRRSLSVSNANFV